MSTQEEKKSLAGDSDTVSQNSKDEKATTENAPGPSDDSSDDTNAPIIQKINAIIQSKHTIPSHLPELPRLKGDILMLLLEHRPKIANCFPKGEYELYSEAFLRKQTKKFLISEYENLKKHLANFWSHSSRLSNKKNPSSTVTKKSPPSSPSSAVNHNVASIPPTNVVPVLPSIDDMKVKKKQA